MRTLSGSPLAAAVALALLAVASACASGPRYYTPQPDRFDRNRSTARENDVEVLPVVAAAAVAVTAAGMLAGAHCN